MITQPQLNLLRNMAQQAKQADCDVALGANVLIVLLDEIEYSQLELDAARELIAFVHTSCDCPTSGLNQQLTLLQDVYQTAANIAKTKRGGYRHVAQTR